MDEIKKLKKEIKSWKETSSIISDKEVMKDIRTSLKEISKGNYLRLKDL